jgi:hypothetical protein
MKRVDRGRSVAAVVAVVVLLQLGSAGVAWFGRQRVAESLQTEQVQLESAQRELERQRERALEQVTPAPRLSTWQLLPAADVAGTMQALQQIGDQNGVVVEDLKALPSNTRGKQAFTLTGRGRSQQVAAFLVAVEAGDRLIVIESGRVMPGGDDELYFELGFATYPRGGGR